LYATRYIIPLFTNVVEWAFSEVEPLISRFLGSCASPSNPS
jgi:hypothetical protein